MVEILKETETLLTEKKMKFLAGSNGPFRDLLKEIWDEYFKYGKKSVCLSMNCIVYESAFLARGFECKIGSKYGSSVYVVSWEK